MTFQLHYEEWDQLKKNGFVRIVRHVASLDLQTGTTVTASTINSSLQTTISAIHPVRKRTKRRPNTVSICYDQLRVLHRKDICHSGKVLLTLTAKSKG